MIFKKKCLFISIIIFFFLFLSSIVSAGLVLNGDAYTSGSKIVLTPGHRNEIGSAWFEDKLNLAEDFDFTFVVYLGSKNYRGDGITFTIHNDPKGTSALGTFTIMGGWIGLKGIKPAIAVEIDTFRNLLSCDPYCDHIGINEFPASGGGQPNHNGAGPVCAISDSNANIENGQEHLLRVSWDSGAKTLRVYFDNSLRLTYTKDIVSTFFDGNPFVYFGFTGVGHGNSNYQYVICYTSVNVSKTVVPDTVSAGGTVTYSINIQNTGTIPAYVDKITDVLPAGFFYITGSTSGWITSDPSISGQILSWSLNNSSIPPGETKTITFQASASSSSGTFYNNVRITGSNFNPVYTGDTAPVVVEGPLIEITKEVNKSNAKPGEEIIYSIKYQNVQSGNVSNLIITDTVPANTSYVPGSLRLGDGSSTYSSATPLTDADDGDEGTVNGNFIFFNIGNVTGNDGIEGSGTDEGKVYFKVKIN